MDDEKDEAERHFNLKKGIISLSSWLDGDIIGTSTRTYSQDQQHRMNSRINQIEGPITVQERDGNTVRSQK